MQALSPAVPATGANSSPPHAEDAGSPVSGRSTPPVAVSARGVRVYDDRGNDYIDASSGPICVNIGHSVPEVLMAMRVQSGSLAFAHRSQFRCLVTEELTRTVLDMAGEGFREVVYTNSGSEATETALRLVMLHHSERGDAERNVVLTQYPSYHGMTAGALGVSGHPTRRAGLEALHDNSASTVPVVSRDPDRTLPSGEEWEDAFARVGAHRVAAVMVEPVGGAASGASVLPDAVFRRLRALCDRHGALLVADEVMTGFGRVGGWFGHQLADVTPDLVVTGKGLSGGYTPIGACVVGRGVLPGRPVTELAFGHTMSGNPLSAATALAVLRFTRERQLPQRAVRLGSQLVSRLADLADSFPAFLGRPRGRGMLLGLPVLQDAAGYARAPLARRICEIAREHGLILYPAGIDHRTQAVLVAPPLTIGSTDVDLLFSRLRDTLRQVGDEVTSVEGDSR